MKRLIRRAVIALENINLQLRVLNDGRDQFHREVLDVLTEAKGSSEAPSRAGATAQVEGERGER